MASTLTRRQLHDFYYFLRLNRRVDEQLTNLYRQGKVVGGVYSGLGQEAISVGTAYALGPGDWIAPMIRNIGALEDTFDTRTLDITYSAERGAEGMPGALDRLCQRAEDAVRGGYSIIIISDRKVNRENVAIPALLALSAIHQHLVDKGLRTSAGLVGARSRLPPTRQTPPSPAQQCG